MLTAVGEALWDVVAPALRELSDSVEPDVLHPAYPPAPGDFAIDLTALQPSAHAGGKWFRGVAERLSELPGVARAAPAPPRVFVTADPKMARAAVVAAADGPVPAPDEGRGRTLCVEYSNPNANKPLHIGHLRNNVLGMALGEMFAARGWRIQRLGMFSDWGVHVCQAMAGYLEWGGDGPDTKPDHYVGTLYRRFHEESARQAGTDDEEAQARTPLHAAARELLRAVDRGDPEAVRVCDLVTGWARTGIEETYARIGSRFDVTASERASIGTARRAVEEAVDRGALRRREDGSTYADLGDLGELTVARGDGSLVVYAQWLGAEVDRFAANPFDERFSVIGREWRPGLTSYLALVRRVGFDWPTEPVLYGMVNLPHGKMKSRSGGAVTADEALDRFAERLGDRLAAAGVEAPGDVADRLAVAQLKLFLLRTPAMKDIEFTEDAVESVGGGLLAGVVAALAAARGEGAATVPPGRGAPGPELVRAIDRLGPLADRAASEREPAVLVRHLDGLCAAATRAADELAEDRDLAGAATWAVERTLGLLNIEPPPPVPPAALGSVTGGRRGR